MKPLALEVERQFGIPYGVCLAQAALETGWGRHVSGNNYFGIKGKGQELKTRERISGEEVEVKSHFRVYESKEESFADYGRLLSTAPRYAAALQAESPEEFARKLQAAGYATDPKYAEKLIALMHKWDLTSGGE